MNNTNAGHRPKVFAAAAVAACLLGLALWYQREIEASAEAMNGPITFWGRVVDQDDNPIPGAKISLSYRTWKSEIFDANATQTKTELVSDQSGGFAVTGMTGDRLTIDNISKPGYLLSPKAKRTLPFANSPQLFSANSNSPEILRMWKKGDSEPTVSREGFFGFQPDGRPYVIDLLTSMNVQSETASGDLRVRITRPESIKPREKYPWTLEIAGVTGGLVETRDEFLYEAPQDGYLPSVRIEMNPTEAGWTSVLEKSYYLKSRDGKLYGAMHITVRPNYGKGSTILIASRLNTNGSTNLEPAP